MNLSEKINSSSQVSPDENQKVGVIQQTDSGKVRTQGEDKPLIGTLKDSSYQSSPVSFSPLAHSGVCKLCKHPKGVCHFKNCIQGEVLSALKGLQQELTSLENVQNYSDKLTYGKIINDINEKLEKWFPILKESDE